MYLSKVILDIRHPSVRQALRDINDLHRDLMAGFSVRSGLDTPRADMRILYRVIEDKNGIYLLMRSEIRPDTAALAERGFRVDDTMIRDISGLKDVFVPGKVLRFELLASPCRKVKGNGKNSRRVFLGSAEERAAWLSRKGEQGGFEIEQVMETGSRTDIRGRRGDADIKNSAILFSGILRITDQDLFWDSYLNGIGPGKAYGLGMLNVAHD